MAVFSGWRESNQGPFQSYVPTAALFGLSFQFDTSPFFFSSHSLTKMTWYTWKHMINCWSPGLLWYKMTNISIKASLPNMLFRFLTLIFSAT